MAATVMVVLAVAAWLVLEAVARVLGVSAPAPARNPVQARKSPVVVEVAPGDTFWSIATRLQPQGDPRPVVDRLVAAHGGGQLQAGERLSVPPG